MRPVTKRRLGALSVAAGTLALSVQSTVFGFFSKGDPGTFLGGIGVLLAAHRGKVAFGVGLLLILGYVPSLLGQKHRKYLDRLLERIHSDCWGSPGGRRHEDYRVSWWAPSRLPPQSGFGLLRIFLFWRGYQSLRCFSRTNTGTTKRRWPIALVNGEPQGLVADLYRNDGGGETFEALESPFDDYPPEAPALEEYLREQRLTFNIAKTMSWRGGSVWGTSVKLNINETPVGVLLVECKGAGSFENRALVTHAVTCGIIYSGDLG